MDEQAQTLILNRRSIKVIHDQSPGAVAPSAQKAIAEKDESCCRLEIWGPSDLNFVILSYAKLSLTMKSAQNMQQEWSAFKRGSGLCLHLQDLPPAMGAAQESMSSVNVEAKWVLCLAKAVAAALKCVLCWKGTQIGLPSCKPHLCLAHKHIYLEVCLTTRNFGISSLHFVCVGDLVLNTSPGSHAWPSAGRICWSFLCSFASFKIANLILVLLLPSTGWEIT